MPRRSQPRNPKALPAAVPSAPEHGSAHPTPEVLHEEAEHVHRRLVDLRIEAAKHSVKKSVKNKT